MIQPTAIAAAASVPSNAGQQGWMGEDRENSADFAALLNGNAAPEPEAAPKPDAALALVAGQPAGKATCKTLPPGLPQDAKLPETEKKSVSSEGYSEEDGEMAEAAAEPFLAPFLVIDTTSATAQVPATEPNGQPARARTAARQSPGGPPTTAPEGAKLDTAALLQAFQLSRQGADAAPQHGRATTPAPHASAAIESPETAPTASASTKSAAQDFAASLPEAPIAAELQPVMAMREAQASAPATPLAAAPAAPQPQGPQDFAALVDRLVEAREATAPQTVQAAVSHGEFGQVSLRFDQDDSGMTVSMTSADPDFAPAVQAASPSQQADASGSDDSAPRPDGQSPQTQPQAQGQARGGQSEPATPAGRAATRNTSASQDDESPARRDGIYA